MDNKKLTYLNAMEIDIFQPKIQPKKSQEESKSLPKTPKNTDNSWEFLEQQVKTCSLCDLSKTRLNTVFGMGSKNADILVIGEAPGANEDKQGLPFVGRAGKLLDSMFLAIGIHRDNVYIANILKCRPPGNRDPKPNEVKLCTPYLKQQIALIQPKLIVTVGRIAAQFLLKTEQSMGQLRQRIHQYENIPLVATYHPAYLLRSPTQKVKVYDDLLKIQKFIS